MKPVPCRRFEFPTRIEVVTTEPCLLTAIHPFWVGWMRGWTLVDLLFFGSDVHGTTGIVRPR